MSGIASSKNYRLCKMGNAVLYISSCIYISFRMQLVEVLGKQKRRVPVLLAPDMVQAIELLISTRIAAGVPSENKYLFPQVNDHTYSWIILI